MNRRESRQHSWSDEEVEGVLTAFFEREMPEALRNADGVSTRDTVSSPAALTVARPVLANGRAALSHRKKTARAPRDVAGIAAVLLAGLAVVAIAFLPERTPTASPHSATSAEDEKSAIRTTSGAHARSPAGDSLQQQGKPPKPTVSEMHQGPVEQQAKPGTSNVSVFEDESDAKMKIELDELKIEIIPIEE